MAEKGIPSLIAWAFGKNTRATEPEDPLSTGCRLSSAFHHVRSIPLARLLAFVTGLVDQELLLHNEYLIAANRILRAQLLTVEVLTWQGLITHYVSAVVLGSRSGVIGLKCAGALSAGNPHATCGVARAGNRLRFG